MYARSQFLIVGFLFILVAGIVCPAQSLPKPETEILADREFEAAMAARSEAIGNAWSANWDAVVVTYRSAIEKFSRARELYRQAGNRKREGESWSRIAELQNVIGERERSLRSHEEAIRVFLAAGEIYQAGRQNTGIGDIYFKARDYHKAIHYYNLALISARDAKDASAESMNLTMIGNCHARLFNRPEAMRHWEQSVKVDEAAGNFLHQGTTLELMGEAYGDAGDRQKALNYYWQAWTSYGKQPDEFARRKASELTYTIVVELAAMGNTHRALEVLKAGVDFDRQFGMKSRQAEKSELFGILYRNLGQPQTALRHLEDALSIYRGSINPRGEASVLLVMSSVQSDNLASPAKGLELAEMALKIVKQLGDVEGQASALSKLGDIVSRIPERKGEEVEFKKQALALYRSTNDSTAVAHLLQDLGIAYRTVDSDKSVQYLNEALMMYATLGLATKLDGPLYWLQRVWLVKGNPKLAVAFGKQGIWALQSQRKNISGFDVESQRGYLRSVERNYRSLASLLLDQKRLDEAHQTLTIFKDQQALDVSENPDEKKIERLSFTPRESRLWTTYVNIANDIMNARQQVESVRVSLGGRVPNADEAQKLGTAEDVLRSKWQKYFDFINGVPQDFAGWATGDDEINGIAEANSIRRTIADVSTQTGQATAAVYQLVTGDGIDFLVVTQEGMKHVRIKDAGIDRKARVLWGLLQTDRYDPRPLGKELFDTVFKPIEKELPADTKTILWSLDGNLRYVPMGVLYDGKRYLVERYNHVTFTRADGDRLTRPISANWNAAAFGSSRAHTVESIGEKVSFSALPGVANELSTLFADRTKPVMKGDVLLDDAFTRDAMLKKLSAKRPVVHIASHFSFRPGDDARSFLLLGDGTAFTLADMKKQKDMFAGVELLTLSACNTAAQQANANGREVDAFFELAQRLGAQSVLATLWPVADNSTPWLMREFYDLKVNKKQNKAEALRNAQLALLNGTARATRSRTRADASQVKIVLADETGKLNDSRGEVFVIEKKDAPPYRSDPKRPFAHPFYWSPFVLIGNWR